MRSLLLFILGLIATTLALLPACDDNISSTIPQTTDELKASLINKNWELRSIEKDGYGIYAPETDSTYTLRFAEDGSFIGKELCNTCGGAYKIVAPNHLQFSDYSCTEMACHGFQHTINFGGALIETPKPFYFKDDRLFITVQENDETAKRFKFAESHKMKDVIMADQKEFERADWPNSSHHMLEAEINGDSLWVKVGFSGCGPHDLNVVFYNYFMESYPVQAYAIVAHKNEACRAVFQSEETFDLSPLKEEYQQYYSDEGTIRLSILQDSTLKQLDYTF